jgi:hypothetical protein
MLLYVIDMVIWYQNKSPDGLIMLGLNIIIYKYASPTDGTELRYRASTAIKQDNNFTK